MCLLMDMCYLSVQMTMSALAATCVALRYASTLQAAMTANAVVDSPLTSTSCPVSVSISSTIENVEK